MNNIYHSDIYQFNTPVSSYWEDTSNENLQIDVLEPNPAAEEVFNQTDQVENVRFQQNAFSYLPEDQGKFFLEEGGVVKRLITNATKGRTEDDGLDDENAYKFTPQANISMQMDILGIQLRRFLYYLQLQIINH